MGKYGENEIQNLFKKFNPENITSDQYPNLYILKDVFMDENDSDGVNEMGWCFKYQRKPPIPNIKSTALNAGRFVFFFLSFQ